MHKKIINIHNEKQILSTEKNWLNLEAIAHVEVSSENKNYPIESALCLNSSSGWRAANEGEQIIRIVFNHPQQINHIMLVFTESESERTQQYQLGWTSPEGQVHEIARQQWNFNSNGSSTEIENHQLSVNDAKVIELCIIPDISNINAIASLEKFRIA